MRTVVLPRSITEQLVEHFARLDGTRPETRIFPAPEGGPIRRTVWMRRVGKPALAPAGLEHDLDTHTLRPFQVVVFITQGEHPRVIADRLAHLGTDRPRQSAATSTGAPTGPSPNDLTRRSCLDLHRATAAD